MINTKYESDEGTVHKIRLTSKALAAAGTPPAGAINHGLQVKVSKTTREFGIKPRGVRIAKSFGTAPDTFIKYRFLPVLTIANFSTAAFALGATITYDGASWEVVSRMPEDY